nr:MAG TPA: hypothetical protein [Ackermannviridae sp.]
MTRWENKGELGNNGKAAPHPALRGHLPPRGKA